jgi:hypothetical protein
VEGWTFANTTVPDCGSITTEDTLLKVMDVLLQGHGNFLFAMEAQLCCNVGPHTREWQLTWKELVGQTDRRYMY